MPVHAGCSGLSEAISSGEWRPFVTGFVVESEDVHRGVESSKAVPHQCESQLVVKKHRSRDPQKQR